eukprot:3810989-Rhodomonas_salina.1
MPRHNEIRGGGSGVGERCDRGRTGWVRGDRRTRLGQTGPGGLTRSLVGRSNRSLYRSPAALMV